MLIIVLCAAGPPPAYNGHGSYNGGPPLYNGSTQSDIYKPDPWDDPYYNDDDLNRLNKNNSIGEYLLKNSSWTNVKLW